MELGFDYELEETHGWACGIFTLGESRFALTHGYCSHPLGVVATVAVRLAGGTGLPRTEAVFDDEPHGWLASFVHRDPTEFELWEHKDVWKREEQTGVLLARAQINSLGFAGSVAAVLHRLYRKHGMTGFLQRWGRYSFPFQQYWHLRLLLDETALIDQVIEAGEQEAGHLELLVLSTEPQWSPVRLAHRTSRIEAPMDL